MNERWISTKQAAELLGVSQRTVQNWVDEGKLKSSRTAGGHRRLDQDEVNKFIQDNYRRQTQESPAEAKSTDQAADNLLRVLVIDDDYSLLRLCELRFAQFAVPHKLYLASNAFEGLIQIGKYQPHLIFTDLKMPEVNGLQVINKIINLPDMQNTLIFVLTALEIREIISMGKLPEGVRVLPKPIPFNTLETVFYQHASELKLLTSLN